MPNISLQTSPNQNLEPTMSNWGAAAHPKWIQALQALLKWTKGLQMGLKCLWPGWEGREQHLKGKICTSGSSGQAGGSDPHPAPPARCPGLSQLPSCIWPEQQASPPQHHCWGCCQPLQPPRPPSLSPELRLRLSQNEKCQEGDLKPIQPLCSQSWARSSWVSPENLTHHV